MESLFIEEDGLAEADITNFNRYAVVPGPVDFALVFFIDKARKPTSWRVSVTDPIEESSMGQSIVISDLLPGVQVIALVFCHKQLNPTLVEV
jgi:hypothetical protein